MEISFSQKYFNHNEISELFKKYEKSQNYYSKYNHLNQDQICLVDSIMSDRLKWDQKDYPRIISILEFVEWIKKYDLKSESMCYTSNDPELKLLPHSSKELYDFDPEISLRRGDLHLLNENEKYDFFMFNQTIEHLYNPFLAIKNIYNSLKPGGYVYTSVPTISFPHQQPHHFNGYTPSGLMMLFASCNFNILEIGQWGNEAYIHKLFNEHYWPSHSDMKRFYPLGIPNEEKNPVQCWILCRKDL